MILFVQKLTLALLAVLLAITLAVNALFLWYNFHALQPLKESSLFELALASEAIAPVVFFGISDYYEADQVSVAEDVMQLFNLTEELITTYSNVETVQVVASSDEQLEIPPDARIYLDVNGASIIFIPTDSPRLQVLMRDDAIIIIMEQPE